jgi:hypothetical protein
MSLHPCAICENWHDYEDCPMVTPRCEWFLLCERAATTTRHHPILGDVPICAPCDERIERLSQ